MVGKMTRVALLAMAAALSGCMSIGSKLSKESQLGYAYSGVYGDLLGMKCASVFPAVAKESDSATYYMLSVPASFVGTILYAIDLPFSAALDTLLLPVDLLKKPTRSSWSLTDTSCDRVHI